MGQPTVVSVDRWCFQDRFYYYFIGCFGDKINSAAYVCSL